MSAGSERQPLRERLTSGRFCYGAELVTTRGVAVPDQPHKVLDLGETLCSDPRLDWVSITDNPGGNVTLPPDWLVGLLARHRAEIVVHMTCKDANRQALESSAWRYASEGVSNIAAMSGDYPRTGFRGQADPVFDLDSVSLIALLEAMNQGLPVPGRQGDTVVLPATQFHIGCVVSPFKRHEGELLPQYFKLLRKIACGARFVYTQVGFDMRKFHEVQLLLASRGLNVPVIGTVYLLNRTVANLFHRGEVPGCVVSAPLLAQVERYAAGPDKGRSFFLDLAAQQLAAFKGLGFAAGYLCGTSKAEVFLEIIDRAQRFGANDWREFARQVQYPQPGEFYLWERDPQTGLGDPHGVNHDYQRSLAHPPASRAVTLRYRFSRFVHERFFVPGTPGFRLLKRLFAHWDREPGQLADWAHQLEKMAKLLLYECRDCGDCSLPEIADLCPLTSCAKNMRNGPCGGTENGRCEVREMHMDCIWARAYERLKFYRETEHMIEGPAMFYNAELKHTSAWANAFLGRDHHTTQRRPPAPVD